MVDLKIAKALGATVPQTLLLTDPMAIREAVLSIRKYSGVNGEFNFDANGDGLRGYNIVKNEDGTVVFIRHIEASS